MEPKRRGSRVRKCRNRATTNRGDPKSLLGGLWLVISVLLASVASADSTPVTTLVSNTSAISATPTQTMVGVEQDQWRIVESGEAIRLGPESFVGLPGLDRPAIRALWEKGMRHETTGEHLEASKTYGQISHSLPDASSPHWRIARSYWRYAEGLPPAEKKSRLHYFLLADEASTRGMELDDTCAECMLWRYASLGRLATTRGVVTAARDASTMANLLKRAIALNPQHRDGAYNSTLGNLYYASATFYRMVPDYFWMKWLIGVKGDKERALRDARKAVSMGEMRVDYQIELGASLLCLGESRKRPQQISEGETVLRHAIGLPHLLPTDAIDQEYAKILLERPEQACAFSRDGFIDVEAAGRQL